MAVRRFIPDEGSADLLSPTPVVAQRTQVPAPAPAPAAAPIPEEHGNPITGGPTGPDNPLPPGIGLAAGAPGTATGPPYVPGAPPTPLPSPSPPPPPPPVAPTTVFVNNSQEYGNFNQIAPPGSTLLFHPGDPGWPAVMAAAQAAGFNVGIWIPQGQGPSDATEYGQYMASLSNVYHPAIIVSNAETLSKDTAWDDTVMGQFNQLAPGQKAGLAVEPDQTINYKPWTANGGQVFVENFSGSGANVNDPNLVAKVVAQGVPAGQVTVLGYRGDTNVAQFGPVANWWVAAGQTPPSGPSTTAPLAPGEIPPEHGSPVTGEPGPAGPLAPGEIPGEHGNPVTGGPTGPTGITQAPRTKIGSTTSPAQDWSSYYFGSWGLDQATLTGLIGIMSKYSDANDAVMAALAYVRGTPWYAKHFPGIQFGIQKGLFNDEAGYRSYVNDVNNLTEQYYGHSVSADQIVGFLENGITSTIVGKQYASNAWVQANQGDVNYELGAFSPEGMPTNEQLDALGGQQAGLPSMLGEQIQNRLQRAVQQMQTMFGGQLGTPNLSLGNKGVSAPSLQGQKSTTDIAA